MNFTWNTTVEKIIGDENHVTGIEVVDTKTNEKKVINTDGIFIYIGNLPNSQLFKKLNITDSAGWILTNDDMETNSPVVFAMGYVRKKRRRQITTAVGDGGIAGQNAYEYVENFN